MSFLKLVAICTTIPPQRIKGEYLNEEDNPLMAVICSNLLDVQMFIIAKGGWDSKFLSYFKTGSKCGLPFSVPPSCHTISDQIVFRSNASGGSLFCTSHHMDVVKPATLWIERHTKPPWETASTFM